jgi:hypothetical protein
MMMVMSLMSLMMKWSSFLNIMLFLDVQFATLYIIAVSVIRWTCYIFKAIA